MAYTIVSASVILLRYQDLPGLGQSGGGDYMALGTLTEEETNMLQGTIRAFFLREGKSLKHELIFSCGIPENATDVDDDNDEFVYARSTGLPGAKPVELGEDEDEDDVDEGLGLEVDRGGNGRGGSPTFPSFYTFMCGLFNADRRDAPTARSARIAAVLTLAYTCAAAGLALLANNAEAMTLGTGGAVAMQVCAGVLAFLMTACLFCLSLQPRTTQKMAFKVPLVPLLPGLSIFVNLYLMLKLPAQTWVRFGEINIKI